MRLPVSKLHRAFVELDPFTDAECAQYISVAQERHRASLVFASVLALLAVCVVPVIGLYTASSLGATMKREFPSFYHRVLSTDLVIGLGICVMFTSCAVVGMLIRDRWVRWAVGKELHRSTCPKCGYQLLGLSLDPNALEPSIRCPECGKFTPTRQLGEGLRAMPAVRALPTDSA